MKKFRIVISIVSTLVIITMLLQVVTLFKVQDLKAEEGKLRLFSMQTNTVYALKGNWEVFPGLTSSQIPDTQSDQMTEIIHLWKSDATHNAYGVTTYRLTLTGLNPYNDYGLYVRDEASAYKLMVNGSTVMTNGNPSPNPLIYEGDMKVTTEVVQSDLNGKIVLVMQIANFDRSRGGFWNPVIIGSVNSIQSYYSRIAATELFVLATMITLGLFFLLLSSIENEPRSFYMSIFAFALAFRALSTGMHFTHELFPSVPLMSIVRLEYLSGYLLLPVTAYLLDSFRFIRPIPYFKRGFLSLALGMVAFTAFAPDYYLEMSYYWFEIMVVIYVVFAFTTIVVGIRKKVEGVSYIVLGILFLIFGALMELFVPQFHYVLYLCSFMFVMLLAISVMSRFATISSRKEHLETAVLTDPLTQLGNRTALFNTLKSATTVTNESQLYILFIDLNKFKHINDVYGHKVGDAVLIEAASRFRRSTRSSDKIFRYGGDEFIILAEISSAFSVETLIQRIRANFETPMVFEGLSLTISLAIGHEVYVPGVNDPDEVIKSSDLKMYENKRVTSD